MDRDAPPVAAPAAAGAALLAAAQVNGLTWGEKAVVGNGHGGMLPGRDLHPDEVRAWLPDAGYVALIVAQGYYALGPEPGPIPAAAVSAPAPARKKAAPTPTLTAPPSADA